MTTKEASQVALDMPFIETETAGGIARNLEKSRDNAAILTHPLELIGGDCPAHCPDDCS